MIQKVERRQGACGGGYRSIFMPSSLASMRITPGLSGRACGRYGVLLWPPGLLGLGKVSFGTGEVVSSSASLGLGTLIPLTQSQVPQTAMHTTDYSRLFKTAQEFTGSISKRQTRKAATIQAQCSPRGSETYPSMRVRILAVLQGCTSMGRSPGILQDREAGRLPTAG